MMLLAARRQAPTPAFDGQCHAKGKRVEKAGERVKGSTSLTGLAISGKAVISKSVFRAEGVNLARIVNIKFVRRENVTRRRVRIRAVEMGRERLAARLADQRSVNRITIH